MKSTWLGKNLFDPVTRILCLYVRLKKILQHLKQMIDKIEKKLIYFNLLL